MALDDGSGGQEACPEHVWGFAELHLSLTRGVEQTQACVRCGAVTYVTDEGRKSRGRVR